jgi:outer membrane translocation and assembly module TamA
MKKRRTLLVLVLVILAFSQGVAQQPQTEIKIAPPIPSLPTTATIPAAQPTKEKSLDQMLDELGAIRVMKAQLEKNEQELLKAIKQKAAKQAERLKQLGVHPKVTNGEPLRIGKIIIEGNEKTRDEVILKMLKFSPGQVLEFPMLEQARARLIKEGFQRAAVEAVPNEPDSLYVDLLIKVVEKER